MVVYILIFTVLLLITLIVIEARKSPILMVGDEKWHGNVAEVDDYTQPRYVYSDGTESVRVKFNVPIIGYRISPTLVLSVHDSFLVSSSDIEDYLAKAKGQKMLSEDDIFVVLENKEALNAMKNAIGDVRVSEPPVWVKCGQNFTVYTGKRFLEPGRGRATLMMKL